MLQSFILKDAIQFSELYGILSFAVILLIVLILGILGVIRLYFLNNFHSTEYTIDFQGNPKVSIHLPICNEPPDLVLKTIESVVNLNYSNFELLVISNNTSDSNLWKPIEAKMMSLDNRFKFVHIEKIKGYKAGALNLALKYTSLTADYIFTLDADYILEENALDIAVGTIQSRNIQLLQFPQSYRNVSTETNGVEINYKHYFDCYLSSAKSKILALPTGTLTIIDSKVFENGTRWPMDSITEDASFGVELIKQKMKIGFCNIVIGRGTMPTEPLDYSKQFKRWVFGNFQVLIKVWRSKGISVMNKIHLSTLLTAWINLLGFIFGILIATLPLLIYNSEIGLKIFYVGIIGIIIHCLFQIVIYIKIAGNNFVTGWNGFLIHLGLLEIGAFYWMSYFISSDKPFVRTTKFLKPVSISNRLYLFPFIIFLLSLVCFIFQHNVIAIFLSFFAIQLIYAKFHKDRELVWSKFNLYKLTK
ncbi:MAG: glycosyltransferase family 2 protein [Psychroserpens sp.]|uniref:glycosyltransferase family 2 protein n=1 Tax=Psychroserpens sp. TaxID=2020870 RepID=UPI003C96F8D2